MKKKNMKNLALLSSVLAIASVPSVAASCTINGVANPTCTYSGTGDVNADLLFATPGSMVNIVTTNGSIVAIHNPPSLNGISLTSTNAIKLESNGSIITGAGILLTSSGSGLIDYSANGGIINGVSGVGTGLSVNSSGGSDVKINLNGTKITGKMYGIQVGGGINTSPSTQNVGNITVSGNIGDIKADDFAGIYLNSSGKNIKISGNMGTVSADGGYGIQAITSGTGEVYISGNGGTIKSLSSTAVDIKNDTGKVSLYFKDAISNATSLSGNKGYGVNIDTGGDIELKSVGGTIKGAEGIHINQTGANTISKVNLQNENIIGTGTSSGGAAINTVTVAGAKMGINLIDSNVSTLNSNQIAIIDTNGDTTIDMVWGSITGAITLGNGSDTLNIYTGLSDVTGVTLFDGGDDTSVADGMIDNITFNGLTYTDKGGSKVENSGSTITTYPSVFQNWEVMNLDNGAKLVTNGELSIGDGTSGTGINVKNGSTIDAGNALVINGNLNIDSSSTFDGTGAGTGVYVINGNVANDGTITTLDGVVGDVVTVNGNYIAGADSKLLFDVELGGDNSPKDSIKINGDASGTGTVVINNVGGTGDATVRGIDLITVSGTNKLTPTLTPGVIQAGAYEYILVKGDTGWNLVSYIPDTPIDPGTPITPVTPTNPIVDIYRPGISNYINTAMANVNGGFAAIDAFQSGSQLGGDEVNHYQDSAHNKNLWARTYVLNEGLEGETRFEYNQNLAGLQVGQDIYSNDEDSSYKHGGLFVDISEGHVNSYDRFRESFGLDNYTGRTDTLAKGIGAYYQYENDKGTYLDTMLLYSLLENKYTDSYDSKSSQDGKRLSAVIGAGINLLDNTDRNWNIQLNGQVGYLKTNMNEFTDSVSIIKSYSSNALRAKLGLKAYINLPESNPKSQFHNTMLYATTNIVQDLTSLKGIEVGNVTVNEKYSKTGIEGGVGIRTQARQNTEFYGDIKGFTNLDSLKKTGVLGTAGVKFTW